MSVVVTILALAFGFIIGQALQSEDSDVEEEADAVREINVADNSELQ